MPLLRQSFPQVVSPLLMAVVVVVIIFSVFVWAWAVRRPVTAGDASEGEPAPLKPITYAAIANLAATFGERVLVVDLFPVSAEVLEHPDYLSLDHFHPSTAGYRRLAEVVWGAMERTGVLERLGRET